MGSPLFELANCIFGIRSVAIIPENNPIVLLVKPPKNETNIHIATHYKVSRNIQWCNQLQETTVYTDKANIKS